jgi:hypothetical protein
MLLGLDMCIWVFLLYMHYGSAHPGWTLLENTGICFLGYLIINRRKCVDKKRGSYDAFQNLKIFQVKMLESFIGVQYVFCVNMN